MNTKKFLLSILLILMTSYHKTYNNANIEFRWCISFKIVKETDLTAAFEQLLKWEGGYANDKNDSGGETYCGISRRSHPKWEGWKFIDSINPRWNQTYPALKEQVYFFYKEKYWNKLRFNETGDKDLSEKLFNISVHFGSDRAVKMLKQALLKLNPNYAASKGNKIDDETLSILYVNYKSKEVRRLLLDTLNQIQIDNYYSIIRRDASKGIYLNSWLKRTY